MNIMITGFDVDAEIIKCEIDKFGTNHEIYYLTCPLCKATPTDNYNFDHLPKIFDYIIVIYSSYSNSSQFLAHSLAVHSIQSKNEHFLCYDSYPKKHELNEIASMSEINLRQLKSIVSNGSTNLTDNVSLEDKEGLFHLKKDLISWAIVFMKTGLPNSFHKAWLKVRHPDDYFYFEYQYIARDGGEIEKFEPINDLYPFRCVEHLDEYLPSNKRNWKTCLLKFDIEKTSLEYEYD